MPEWRDIPGLTVVDRRPCLPVRPEAVARALNWLVEADNHGGVWRNRVVDAFARELGEAPERIEGLLGWLPLSRVAAWNADDGRLSFDPTTDVVDLAVRYGAWASTQVVAPADSELIRQYAKTVVDTAVRLSKGNAPKPQTIATIPALTTTAIDEVRHPSAPLLPDSLTDRIRGLLTSLDDAFLERKLHARMALLALIAGQHVLLLGPPGTGKSLLARGLCSAFATNTGEARYFEYLLSRFTHPDELFGPVSIPGLKQEDYRRITEGFLPTAHVAFLDEIFKANSAILNSLLTLVNERVFHHGRHRDAAPLIGLIGASNELPDPEGGLSALFDRFLVRLTVPPVAEEASFLAVATAELASPTVPSDLRLALPELEQIRQAADQVTVPPIIAEALTGLWRRSQRLEWAVSDRRWRQAVHLLKVAAATDGRRALHHLDLLLLESVLAPEPSRLAEVRDALLEHLGARTIPSHDLRAQWMLLYQDRVAPIPGEPPQARIAGKAPWADRLAQRQEGVRRLLYHHLQAVERLAIDRSRLESRGDGHVWIAELPVQLLSAHIEAARDLAKLLEQFEHYRDAIADPPHIVAALLAQLPTGSRRMYGNDAAVTLSLPDAGLHIGITLSGETVTASAPADSARSGSATHGAIVNVASTNLLDWLDGGASTESLVAKVPSWAQRQAITALDAARRLVGSDPIPRPPELV